MCGIFGLIHGHQDVYLKDLIIANDAIAMRGPERSHYIHSNSYTLAFHRLAINGLSPAKDQPYVYDNSGENHFYLLCNGEIYNAKELYKSVLGLDWVDGMSDTQVIYDLWRHFDYDFTKLNQELLGEYALAILVCDQSDKPSELYLSTDYISVRPVFYYIDTDTGVVGFSSLLSGLSKLHKPELIKRLPGNKMVIIQFNDNSIVSYRRLSISDDPVPSEEIIEDSTERYYKPIVDTLCDSVKRRMISDREIGCLLSGGLDSSLTSALVALEAKKVGKQVHTFSIGFAGSPDCKYARIVADHIGSIHTEITVTEQEALAVIPEVIRVTETFDITSVRASVWQLMLARYIAKHHPDIKVVVAGEGSDELLGYVYLKMAPNQVEFQRETEKLTHNIHLFDGIRADRCISHYGLEARFPFLDEHFVRLILSLPPVVKMHTDSHREKWILREAFTQLMPELLPPEILWRPKAAMSDATSSMERSWFSIIQEHIAGLSIDHKTLLSPVTHMVPPTEEATYFRAQWQRHFPEEASRVIPYYWLPNQEWCPDAKDPSARTLSFYHGEKD